MSITQCQRQKQIVLVCFQDSLSISLQVERANSEGYLWETYPFATNIVYLPGFFDSIAHSSAQ
jgi:hypothetical protein